jgi:Adenosylmethionine decarboxylase
MPAASARCCQAPRSTTMCKQPLCGAIHADYGEAGLHAAESHAAKHAKSHVSVHRFEPCGYSMNGMDGAQASTIHITPELGFSYASVEVFCQVCDRVSAVLHSLSAPFPVCNLGAVRHLRRCIASSG